MSKFIETTGFYLLLNQFTESGWKTFLMLCVSLLLLWLAIHKKFEPLLLVGIAMGVLVTNLPGANLYHPTLWDAYTYELSLIHIYRTFRAHQSQLRRWPC